jgi:hypothetical protein
MDMNLIKNVPMLAINNKSLLQATDSCGCYHCGTIMPTKEITKWTDKEQTAVCPFCTCDCIIPAGNGIALSKESLQKIHDHWLK